jgi:D-alanine--poly(phosphoribitol) ligase subunit 1
VTSLDSAGTGSEDALGLILRHAAARPEAVAMSDGDQCLTYGQLVERVAAMASGLSCLGVERGDRVALWLPNSVALLVVALGCLWIGAPFVPLSTDNPAARLAEILNDSDPTLTVTPEPKAVPGGRLRRVVSPAAVLDQGGPLPPRSKDAQRDAYLIYTSGTTGRPKGVRTPEGAFRWAIASAAELLGLDASTRTLCVSPLHFDGAYGTTFPPLVAGGSLVIPRREELLFIKPFYRAILEEGITHTGFSPTYLRMILSSPLLPSLGRSQLRILGLGGEECLHQDLARLWELLPELRVFNRYGPTETTIEVTTHEVDRLMPPGGKVPIGRPHHGVGFYLVDADRGLIERPHQLGELYIGGPQLMNGYWGDEALTAQVLDRQIVPGQTLYKTGDLAYTDDAGLYVYAGRADDVVKRRGVRISLGEITRVLRAVKTVSGAACLALNNKDGTDVVAFAEAGPDMTVEELLDALGTQLPSGMIPDRVIIVPSLPMSSSGKIDRHRLLAMAGQRAAV